MQAKSQIKKRQITGRAIFRSRVLSRYYGPVSWTRSHRLVRRREGVLDGSAWLPLLLIFFLVSVSASIWFGWRIGAGLEELGRKEVRFKTLFVENRVLALKMERLSARGRIEKIAARRGLYRPRSRQLIRLR